MVTYWIHGFINYLSFEYLNLKVARLLKNDSANLNVGLLDHDQFNFTVLTSSNSSKNPLPKQIKVGGHCFGKNLDIILTQIEGNSSYIKSEVWKIDGETLDHPPSNKIVAYFIWILFLKSAFKTLLKGIPRVRRWIAENICNCYAQHRFTWSWI